MSVWRKLWIAWSILGLGSLAVLLVLSELGVVLTSKVWIGWAIPVLGWFTIQETWGVIRKAKGDTLSEMVWDMKTARSIIIFACLWGIVAITTGNVWPSFPAFVFAWCAWHFWKEGPYAVY